MSCFPRHLLGLAVGSLLVLSPAPALAQTKLETRVTEILQKTTRGRAPEAAQALRGIGDDAITVALLLYWGDPRPETPKDGIPTVIQATPRKRRVPRDVFEAVFRALPKDMLNRACVAALAGREGVTARLLALHTLKDFGNGASFGVLPDVLDGLSQRDLASGAVQMTVTRLTRALEFEKGAGAALRKAGSRLPSSVRRCVIEAMLDTPSRGDAELLLSMMGDDHITDATILLKLSEAPAVVLAAVTPHHWSHLQHALTAKSWQVRATAYSLAAQLNPEVWAPRLTRGLADRHPRARHAALMAIRRATGQRFGPVRRRWEAWFEQEETWLENELPALLTGLLDETKPERHAQMLARIAHHRLARSTVADTALDALTHDDPRVRIAACRAAGHLKLASLAEDLLILLRDEEITVVTAAADALRQLFPPGSKLEHDVLRKLLD